MHEYKCIFRGMTLIILWTIEQFSLHSQYVIRKQFEQLQRGNEKQTNFHFIAIPQSSSTLYMDQFIGRRVKEETLEGNAIWFRAIY